MKTAYKWNGQEYTDTVLPSGATLGVEDINQNITCAECGRVINFKESYTSKTIHNEIGRLPRLLRRRAERGKRQMSDYDDYENNLFFEPIGDMSKLNDCNEGKRGSDVLLLALEKCQKIANEYVDMKRNLAHSEKMRDLNAEYVVKLEEKLRIAEKVASDVELWLNGMVGAMNNESSEHNKRLPIGNFESAFKSNADALGALINKIKE